MKLYKNLIMIGMIVIGIMLLTSTVSGNNYTQPYSISAYGQGSTYTITVTALSPLYYNTSAQLLIIDSATGQTIYSQAFTNSTTIIQTLTASATIEVTINNGKTIMAYQTITPYIPPSPAVVGDISLTYAVLILFVENLVLFFGLRMSLIRRVVQEKSKVTHAFSKDVISADIQNAIDMAQNVVDTPEKKEAVMFWAKELEKRGLTLKPSEGDKDGDKKQKQS